MLGNGFIGVRFSLCVPGSQFAGFYMVGKHAGLRHGVSGDRIGMWQMPPAVMR